MSIATNAPFLSWPLDFKPMDTKRAKRCCSCQTLVRPGDDIVGACVTNNARSDIEERIYGEGCDVPMASWILCEEMRRLVYGHS